MGDSGEGLIDAETRIQERMEELAAARIVAKPSSKKNPEIMRQLDSLNLARTQLARQLESATHENRRLQIGDAISAVELRIAELNQENQR